ncbi:hypothetical protein TRICI_003001 [Trichomonascus ciferrii]|uniref:Uncharacterized protein n=1 Tax=Trichomonascus ciferrii TaxID=44093 RepID=A0A642V557_9ASCO|nr:hypothetical protein TRICI_003001 [Trichomonascus ciferrii]
MGILNDVLYYYEVAQQFRGVVVFVLPFVLPWLRKVWNGEGRGPAKPVGRKTWALIGVLLAVSVLQVYYWKKTIEENVFWETGSRMQTSGEVLGSRLKKLRQRDYLGEQEELMISRFATDVGRALYTVYGTDAYMNCEWCEVTDGGVSLLIYSLPSILCPYLINLFGTLVATGGLDRNARQWRLSGVIVSFVAMLLDVYTVFTFPYDANRRAKVPRLIQWLHWDRHNHRTMWLCGFNVALGLVLYLSASGRFYHVDVSVHSQLKDVSKQLDDSVRLLSYTSMSKDAVDRNALYRQHEHDFWSTYWQEQDKLNEEIEDDFRVKDAKESAKQRVNLNASRRLAADFFKAL